MTASQPPEPPPVGGPQPPPGYGQQPPPGHYGQQPPAPGAPGYGKGYGQAPSWSAPPPPGYGPPPQPGYGPPVHGPGGPGAPSAVSVDFSRLRIADWVVPGGTLLFLVLSLFPWWDYGDEFFFAQVGGFESPQVSAAFVLFLLATAWALLPAFYELKLGFPRSWVTVGLTALGFLLTLVAWIDTFDAGFSIWALLGLLAAAAILLFALVGLLPELRNRPALPGALVGAAQWANQPAPDPTAGGQPGTPAYGTPPPPPPPATPPPAGQQPPGQVGPPSDDRPPAS